MLAGIDSGLAAIYNIVFTLSHVKFPSHPCFFPFTKKEEKKASQASILLV